MREIKFRVWDKYRNQLYICDDIYFAQEPLNEAFKLDEFDFMQYTGLKDANDKEIYEGDVVADQYGYRFEIVFRDGCWFAGNSEVGFSPKDTWNVIGNIYENPELLGDKTNE